MGYGMTNQKQVRESFWANWDIWEQAGPCQCARPRKQSNGDWPINVRCAFVDFVDTLQRAGEISESLAHRVTL